jgi:2-methylcitrate dehydratase PrpD
VPTPIRITESIAARAAQLRFTALPSAARTVAKQCLLDFIGVAIAARDEPLVRILRDEIADAGGHAQASLIGLGAFANAEQAALLNGAAGHAHDYDDVHLVMNGHPTVPVMPAVLALAERHRRTGAELLTAFAAGVDTECLLGRYLGPSHYEDGWHATGTLGAFGAAAASANLLGLDVEATARALGIAGTQAAGLKSQFGTMVKPLHAGHAAATGVSAAYLARRGFSSRTDLIETEQGFAATQSRTADPERLLRGLGVATYLPDVCFKYHAACYLTHSAITATRGLADDHGIDHDDVTAVTLTVPPGHFRVCNIATPKTGLEVKFSLRMTTAMALAGRDTSAIDAFTDALASDPTLVRLRDRVTVTARDDARRDTHVRIETMHGHFERELDVGVPARDLDAQWNALGRKFHALVGPRLGDNAASRIESICHAFEEHDDPSELCALIRGDA